MRGKALTYILLSIYMLGSLALLLAEDYLGCPPERWDRHFKVFAAVMLALAAAILFALLEEVRRLREAAVAAAWELRRLRG